MRNYIYELLDYNSPKIGENKMETILNRKKKIFLSIAICVLFIVTAFSSAAMNNKMVDKKEEPAIDIERFDNQDIVREPAKKSNSEILGSRGSVDINPTDDASVSEGNPDNTYGTGTGLYVQSTISSSYGNERAWLKFDIGGLVPGDATINSATLRLYCWKADGQNMYASVNSSADDTWLESSITWNNQPTFDSGLDTLLLTVGDTGVKEWDVTSFVQNEWGGDKVVSFVVKPTEESSSTTKTFAFESREWTGVEPIPILRIDHTGEVSEPPVVSDIPDQTIYEQESFTTIPLDDYVDDPDTLDSEIVWTYTGNSELDVTIDPVTHVATIITPDSEWIGQETITFRATDPTLLWDEDSAEFKVTSWMYVSTSPYVQSYGVGVVGAGEYIFIANSHTSGSSKFMRYNTGTGTWTTYTNSPYEFKNCVAMVWDGDNYIYVLFGASYGDIEDPGRHRHYFQRFNIASESWEALPDTPWYQGPGDAITWINDGNNEYIYAVLGSSSCASVPDGYPGPPFPEGVQFWRYNITSNVWDQNLTRNPYGSDDGADLAWTGGDFIYSFCGAYNEGLPKDEERHFLRYSISTDSWVELENTPYKSDGGVDDCGSLLYPNYGDYIYALKGGDDGAGGGGSPGDDFWRYSISTDNWEILSSIPLGVGDLNGHRLGLSGGNIFCWRGCFSDGTLWSYPIGYLLNLIDFPMYLSSESDFFNENQLCGGAVAQMNLNYMWWNSSEHPGGVPDPGQFDDQEYLFNYSAQGDQYMDAEAMHATIQELDPSFYNFGIYHNIDSSEIIADICYWIDYDVPGVDPGYPGHVPGAVPAYGDYSNWMSIRGIHTNHSVYGRSDALTVHGFWVNDPYPSGIGENTYKMAGNWLYAYYLPLNVPGDPYNGQYVAICEPPEDAVSDIELVETTQYWDNIIPDPQSGSNFINKIFNHLIIYAATQGAQERVCPYDTGFAEIFEQSYPGRPMIVKNLLVGDEKHDFYIVPYNNVPTGFMPRNGHSHNEEEITQVAVIVNAETGQFQEASWVDEPVKYLSISASDAREIVYDALVDMGINPDDLPTRALTLDLVYRGGYSQFSPEWRIIISELGLTFYVNQDSALS